MIKHIQIKSISRITSDGEVEELTFLPGVNIITGKPNAGKSTWLKQIDFLLGKNGNIKDTFVDNDLAMKYVEIIGLFDINDSLVTVVRKPLTPGLSSKIFVDDIAIDASNFSSYILELLNIPNTLKFPKGNPYNSQWVELSFRSILRHMYRREDFWSDIADRQPPNEQFAAQYQLLGIAQYIYSDEYNKNVSNEKQLAILEAQKFQYKNILDRIAQEMAPKGEELLHYATETDINIRIETLEQELIGLSSQKDKIINDSLIIVKNQEHFIVQKENEILSKKESFVYKLEASKNILQELKQKVNKFVSLSEAIQDELLKLKRTKKSGIISDLKITVCPACDQYLTNNLKHTSSECFLCHQTLSTGTEAMKQDRIDFEIKQLSSESEEVEEIIKKLNDDISEETNNEKYFKEELFYIEREIAPLKKALFSLTHTQLTEIDIQTGRIQEQIQNYNRLLTNLKYKDDLTTQINKLESLIQMEKAKQESLTGEINFSKIAEDLESGMQYYVDKISNPEKEIWANKGKINVAINDSKITFYVNNKSWNSLGGRDKDFFLLSYHFGFLTLTGRKEYNYPGLVIIDLPPDLGEVKVDSYNYIVEPFTKYAKVFSNRKPLQVIFTGRSFENIQDANVISLETSWK